MRQGKLCADTPAAVGNYEVPTNLKDFRTIPVADRIAFRTAQHAKCTTARFISPHLRMPKRLELPEIPAPGR